MARIAFQKKPVLLDGGLGRELRIRGVRVPETIWSAGALMTDPAVVRQIHLDYIAAGADVITTNTYGVIRGELAKEGIEDRFAELNTIACKLAMVLPREEIETLYQEQADLLAPHVDLFLCETMSSGTEGRAAARAACRTGKPVWVAWTLHEDRSGKLRNGETIQDAVAVVQNLPISGFLANCCAPESITSAIPQLRKSDVDWIGGYANTFAPIPHDWTLDGEKETDGLLTLRSDLDPENYSVHVAEWLADGATVVGGCCGTGPAHIAKIRTLIEGV